jgi:hypothetical protein
MSEKVIRIEVTVEPRVTKPTKVIVEVPVSELTWLTPEAREETLFTYAENTANEMLPWGWEELPGEHDPEVS